MAFPWPAGGRGISVVPSSLLKRQPTQLLAEQGRAGSEVRSALETTVYRPLETTETAKKKRHSFLFVTRIL